MVLAASFCLLLISIGSYSLVHDHLHPSVVFSAIWGILMLLLFISSSYGYFPFESGALLFVIISILTFSIVSLATHSLFSNRLSKSLITFPTININIRKLIIYFLILNIIVIPIWYIDIQSIGFGNNLIEKAYFIRHLSTNGEKVFGPLVGNYFIFGFILMSLVTVLLVQKKINIVYYLFFIFPFISMGIISNGRAALIKSLLSIFFVYKFTGGKISFKFIIIILSLFVIIFIGGALLVGKQGIELNMSFSQILLLSLQNLADYILQGAILFSRYYVGIIHVTKDWTPMQGIEIILHKFGYATTFIQNLVDFNYFTENRDGNVYSIFFSTYPRYGFIGNLLWLSLYSIIVTVFYTVAKRGNIYALLVSAYFFGALILSIFSDGIGSSLYLLLKTYIFFKIIKLFLFEKKGKIIK